MTQAQDTSNTLETRAAENRRRAVQLSATFGAFVFLVFAVILSLLGGGIIGLVIALVIPGAWLAVARVRATAVVLDLSEADAADEVEHARLFNVTAGMCTAMGVSAPELYVVDDPALNAMTAGTDPKNSVVVVTQGLLETCSLVELEAVVSLLLYRIKSGAAVAETLVVPTYGAVGVLGEAADHWERLSAILTRAAAPTARVLAWLHPGRNEIFTDVEATQFTRYPPALATALEKMSGHSALAMGSAMTSHLWVAAPISVAAHPFVNRIHAPLEERIAVLQEL